MKKTFSNGFSSMDLTRDEYINHWLESTHHYTTMFFCVDEGTKLMNFQGELMEVAGKYWDNHK